MTAPRVEPERESRYRGSMARYDFRTPRLYLDAPLDRGTRIETDKNQANYLLNVLRLDNSGKVLLFNGRDGEWLADIERQGKKKCALVPVSQTRQQPEASELIYCFAPLKHARLDYMVQKAVEMGAGVLQPILTHHTQNSRVNIERIRANAIEAAEQCGILSVPETREPIKFNVFLDQWNADTRLVFCDESASDKDTAHKLAELDGKKLAVLIGPEGGFSQEERELLLSKSFVTTISLGPRILRADTAAVAAFAVVQLIAGDWKQTKS
ncbi:MAG: 16S rRNA (uracil(1498)-N(3))-methyltransferase [Pseudomonadota bacterium]